MADFKNIEEFFNSIKTPLLEESISKFGYGTKWTVGQDFDISSFERFISDIKDPQYYTGAQKEIYDKLPLKVVEYVHVSDSDMDHGQWTDTYVVEVNGKYYEFELEYFGQGDFDRDNHNEVFEVFPKEITKIIYERK